MPQLKYKRILLKVSGEALAGSAHRGLDFDIIHKLCLSIKECVDMGVQIQMNAGSILGEEGLAWKWFCKKAMKHGLLHYIGSDAHDMVHRRPNLGKCAAYVERIMGKEYRDTIMMVNPQRITEGSAWEDYE